MPGPFLLFFAALIGFFASAAVYHLFLWWPSRRERLLGIFALDCGLRAAICAALVEVSTAGTPEQAEFALSARIGFGVLSFVTTLWILPIISHVRAVWFVRLVTVVLVAFVAVHVFVLPLNPPALSVAQFVLPWGETISVPRTGAPGWWVLPLYVVIVGVDVFGLYCASRLRARDRLAGTLVLMATAGTLVVLALDALRTFGVFPSPFIGVFPQVLWVSAMAQLIARDHWRTQEALAASEHRFHGIFDQTFQFIGLMKTDGTLVEVNRTALEFAGIRAEDVIGKPFWETPWWSHSPELQSRLRAAVLASAAGETVRFEATHPRHDGRLAHVDFSLKPIHDERRRVTMLIPEGWDITESKEAEERRRVLEAQLAQAQKMEAIGQLAGGVAHDFNNLLTVINGYGELLQAKMPQGDDRDMLDGIVDAGQRAAVLNRQLLTFSRQQVVERRVIDLNAVVAETETMLRRLIGEDIQLVGRLAHDLPPVKADPGQMSQVMLNLAVNARDAMPTGGTLVVETTLVDVDRTASALHPEGALGRYVVLSVSDTGSGMTAEVRARIFEPFFTTKGPGKGTGLGLATVRTIAEESGGLLHVTSEPGHGSTFRLYLPALSAPATAERLALHTTAPRGNETVLFVEDDEAVRSLTLRILQELGYAVIAASGGMEAVRLVEQHKGPIHIVISDVVMPDISGRQLVERLALTRPGLRVLYLSGYTDDAVVRHGVLEAEVAFLQKPYTVDALATKVRETLDKAPRSS